MFGGSVSPNGPGEIMMRGRHVFMGYLNDEVKTKEAVDDEGWLHSGDIGRVDSNNLLYITGRIKVTTKTLENSTLRKCREDISLASSMLDDTILFCPFPGTTHYSGR